MLGKIKPSLKLTGITMNPSICPLSTIDAASETEMLFVMTDKELEFARSWA
jgi:hypothetical protein